MSQEKWLKGFKFTIASVIAIVLANLLGLKYATTAGIITILSIQNTKKETLKVAGRRAAAYICALVIAAFSFRLFGFSIIAFAVYLFVFSCVCLFLGWPEAISMCSVLVSHFLTEQSMDLWLLQNETLLFVIGAGMGILANLHLHRKADEFDALAQQADEAMCAALKAVAGQLQGKSGSAGKNGAAGAAGCAEAADCAKKSDRAEPAAALKQLTSSLEKLQACAHRNWNNTLFSNTSYETDYADMRSGQAQVLRHISSSAAMLEVIPKQAAMVADLLTRIQVEYERKNTVEALLAHMQQVYADMRREPLPRSREEFEARAVLFYVLKQAEEFLMLKRRFALVHKLK